MSHTKIINKFMLRLTEGRGDLDIRVHPDVEGIRFIPRLYCPFCENHMQQSVCGQSAEFIYVAAVDGLCFKGLTF